MIASYLRVKMRSIWLVGPQIIEDFRGRSLIFKIIPKKKKIHAGTMLLFFGTQQRSSSGLCPTAAEQASSRPAAAAGRQQQAGSSSSKDFTSAAQQAAAAHGRQYSARLLAAEQQQQTAEASMTPCASLRGLQQSSLLTLVTNSAWADSISWLELFLQPGISDRQQGNVAESNVGGPHCEVETLDITENCVSNCVFV